MSNTNIYRFIQNLSELEQQVILNSFETEKIYNNSNNGETKELLLFKIILTNKHIELNDTIIKQELETSRLDMLKKKLSERITESFTNEKLLSNKISFNELDRNSFYVRKKLLVVKVLIRTQNPGKSGIIEDYLEEIIQKCIDFELYDTLTEALSTKKYFIGIRHGLQKFTEIDEELKKAENCLKCALYANDSYFKLILNNDFVRTLPKKAIDKHIEDSIIKMTSDYKVTRSDQINYFIHIFKFALCERKKDYHGAINNCNIIIKLLKTSKVVFRSERMGFILDNLSQFYSFLENYEDAAKSAKSAQNYYLENSLNYIISLEQEFYVHFYNKDFKNAEKCLNKLLLVSNSDVGDFRVGKYNYFNACIKFSLGKYSESLHLLTKSLEIEKDKLGWNIAIRFLLLMIFIELQKIDEASNTLESTRKYIDRKKSDGEISQRTIQLLKIFKQIEKSNFSVTTTSLENIKNLNSPELTFQLFSPELINIGNWLTNKSEKQNV